MFLTRLHWNDHWLYLQFTRQGLYIVSWSRDWPYLSDITVHSRSAWTLSTSPIKPWIAEQAFQSVHSLSILRGLLERKVPLFLHQPPSQRKPNGTIPRNNTLLLLFLYSAGPLTYHSLSHFSKKDLKESVNRIFPSLMGLLMALSAGLEKNIRIFSREMQNN